MFFEAVGISRYLCKTVSGHGPICIWKGGSSVWSRREQPAGGGRGGAECRGCCPCLGRLEKAQEGRGWGGGGGESQGFQQEGEGDREHLGVFLLISPCLGYQWCQTHSLVLPNRPAPQPLGTRYHLFPRGPGVDPEGSPSYLFLGFKYPMSGTSLLVQWLRLCTPNAKGPGSILDQKTGSCMLQLRIHRPQLRVCMLQLQIPHAVTKIKDPVCCS